MSSRNIQHKSEEKTASGNLLEVHHLEALQAFTQVSGELLFVRDIIDYTYKFVSGNFIEYSGYSKDEVLNMGEKAFETVIAPEDIQFLKEHEPLFYQFVAELPQERQKQAVLVQNYSFLHKNGSRYPVSIHLSPFEFDSSNKLQLVLGRTNFCPRMGVHEAIIIMMDTKESFRYDIQKKNFFLSEITSLSQIEKNILIYGVRGYTEKELATKFSVSVNTVKKHKSNIFNRLSVNNITEAYVVALNMKMFY